MPNAGPFPLVQILQDEYAALRPNSDVVAANDLSALCLSGGGIRSATFALGIIQGLADHGVLGDFDYLSTVSGGGYIGSWLTSWKQREGGLEKVMPQLRQNAPPVAPGATDPIEHLREYNNFLSPKLGLFSTDTWTLAATVSRNMFLNWLVLVPLLLFALMAPRLILSLARLGETFPEFYQKSTAQGALTIIVPAISAALFALTIYNILRYLPGVGKKNHSEFDFLRFVFLPLIGATVAFITNDSWFSGGDQTRPGADFAMGIGYPKMMLGVVGSAFFGWLAYFIFCGKSWRERWRLFLPVSGAVLLTGWSAGSAAWILTDYIYPNTGWALYTTVAMPLLILALLLAGCLFVGFTSLLLEDEDREWLSRAGAWFLLYVVCWAGICTLVLLAPMWAFTLPAWGQSALGAIGVASGWISALTGSSSKTKANKESVTSGDAAPRSTLISLAMKLAAPVFAGAFLVGLSMLTNWVLKISHLGASSAWDALAGKEVFSYCPNCEWWEHTEMLEGTRWEAILLLGLAYLLFGWLMARFININKFSLQAMYRNRLIRAYLGASNASRKANTFTGFAKDDNMKMHNLDKHLKPFHVVNVCLNLVAGDRLAWQQRKAESFTMSPLHCGCAGLGYRPSRNYGGPDGISLGTAVAISGAAASPNMGYHSSAVIGFIMTLFNARLGSWLGNPGKAGEKTWRQEGPTSASGSIVKEAFGLTNDTSQYVYLSDGGHFENLGVYEMVRRRCRYIVVSDAGCDADLTYEDLGNALRKIRIDMKIPVDFGEFKPLQNTKKRCAVARIRYSLIDTQTEDGYLLYIKPIMLGNEPPDVASYQSDHQDFPHQSTADQFFDESQTESYRMLGLHTVAEICAGWNGDGGIPGLLDHASGMYLGEGRSAVAEDLVKKH